MLIGEDDAHTFTQRLEAVIKKTKAEAG